MSIKIAIYTPQEGEVEFEVEGGYCLSASFKNPQSGYFERVIDADCVSHCCGFGFFQSETEGSILPPQPPPLEWWRDWKNGNVTSISHKPACYQPAVFTEFPYGDLPEEVRPRYFTEVLPRLREAPIGTVVAVWSSL